MYFSIFVSLKKHYSECRAVSHFQLTVIMGFLKRQGPNPPYLRKNILFIKNVLGNEFYFSTFVLSLLA